MSDYLIMKAVEHGDLSAKFRKLYPTLLSMAADGFWTQKKYDGCMGIAMITFDLAECRMLSRTGEDYSASTRHLLRELHEAACERGYGSWDDFIVIGEVWQPIEEAKFPAISGKFRRKAPSPELRFIANDLLPPGFNTPRTYRDRYADLVALLPPMEVAMVNVAFTDTIEPNPEVAALLWQGQGGYDGAILRDPDAGYKVGTVKAGEIVKVKPTLSLDLRCNGVIQGEGKHLGRLGAVTVDYKGVTSAVGTGFSDEDREMMWQGATRDSGPGSLWHPHNPINRIVEIECLGITEDGKLREPRYKGVRFDKTKAD